MTICWRRHTRLFVLLTAGFVFVRVVFAVFFAVAQQRFRHAHRFAVQSAFRAQKFTRARDCRTVFLVAAVVTIRVTVALVVSGYATVVGASELADVAGGEICKRENTPKCESSLTSDDDESQNTDDIVIIRSVKN